MPYHKKLLEQPKYVNMSTIELKEAIVLKYSKHLPSRFR